MENDWIDPEADKDDWVRTAYLDEIDEGVAKFSIDDEYLDTGETYEQTPVAVGYAPAEPDPDHHETGEVPERFEPGTVFRVVPPDEGEFVVSNDVGLGTYDDGFGETAPVVGLRYDPEFEDEYTAITSAWVEEVMDDDSDPVLDEQTGWDEI